jgi:hypothetical protein
MALIGLGACSESTEESLDLDGIELPEGYQSLIIEKVLLKDSAGDCSSDPPRCARISFGYPQFIGGAGEESLEALNSYVQRHMQVLNEEEGDTLRPLEEVMHDFIRDFEEFNADFDPEYRIAWELDRHADVLFQSPRLVSLSVSEYADYGGAHGQSFLSYFVYDLQEERVLALEDLFLPESMEAVTTMGELFFRDMKGLMEGESLDEAGFWFPDNAFYLPDNFAISGNELIFFYNNYEIQSYADGPTELVLPLYELQIWLKEAYQPDPNLEL